MTSKPLYLSQLEELLKAFTQEEIAAALDITTRTLQNYTTKESPTVPRVDTIRKINEIYLKYKEGEDINNSETMANDDYQSKYVALLEKQLKEKDKQLADLEKINKTFAELKTVMLESREKYDRTLQENRSYLQLVLERLKKHFAKTEKGFELTVEENELFELIDDDMDKRLLALLTAIQ